jgi:hypothetical protein
VADPQRVISNEKVAPDTTTCLELRKKGPRYILRVKRISRSVNPQTWRAIFVADFTE